MRRTIVLLATMTLTLLVASGVALAVTRIGTDGPDTLRGTKGDDNLLGKGANDTLLALGGNDNLLGGSGKDIVNGGNLAGPFGGNKNLVGGEGNDAVQGGLGSDNVLGGKVTTSWRVENSTPPLRRTLSSEETATR
jgi:Ca2+-binding RTX toxin-like protein